jgi:MFS family permease
MALSDAGTSTKSRSAFVPLRRNRDFQLLWSGLAVSIIGSRVSMTAYPLLVLSLTHSPRDAGLVGFCATLPYVLVQLPAGAIVDRVNRKWLMIACDAGRALALGSLVAALAAGVLSLVHVIVVAFFQGVLFVFFNLSETAAIAVVVPSEQLPAALSQNQARIQGAGLAGPPLSGLFFGISRAAPFLADACSYVVSIAVLLFIRSDFREEREPVRGPLLSEVGEGVRWLWRQSFLRTTVFLSAWGNLLIQALVLILIVAAREHGTSSAAIGLMLGGGGAGGVAGAIAASRLQRLIAPKTVVRSLGWIFVALMPVIVFSRNVVALGLDLAVMAFVAATWNVLIGSYQLTLTPDRLMGRVASADQLLSYGALPLGSLSAGFVLGGFGTTTATVALTGGMLVLASAATISPSVRGAPSLEEAARAASVPPSP